MLKKKTNAANDYHAIIHMQCLNTNLPLGGDQIKANILSSPARKVESP